MVAPERVQGGSKELRHIYRQLLQTLNEEPPSNMAVDALLFFTCMMSIFRGGARMYMVQT